MTASLPPEIKPEQFANHYGKNWSNRPQELNIEEYNELTRHDRREKLNLKQFKGNLSAPGLDRLTYPIFKYCPDKATKVFVCILKMMRRTN
jgi:hypothetical protein